MNHFKYCFATQASGPTSYQLLGLRPVSSPIRLQVKLLDRAGRCTLIQ